MKAFLYDFLNVITYISVYIHVLNHLHFSVRPLGVRIMPSHGLCKEGLVVDFRCRAWGSRPAAEITWWMKTFRLYNVTGRIVDRDSSSSSLSIIPLASDHGNVITCKAENPRLPGRIAVDNVTLNVTCEY